VTDRPIPGGGGLTGATGDLTPDDTDEPFVPAERREQAGEHSQGSVTYRQGTSASAQQGEIGDPGVEHDPGHALNREAGYGSQHGLSPNDPAYSMDIEPPAAAGGGEEPSLGTPDRLRRGVDTVTDQEERF
jgi:hypothetical protein